MEAESGNPSAHVAFTEVPHWEAIILSLAPIHVSQKAHVFCF